MVLLCPFRHIVRGLLLLKPLEDYLILTCDLHEFSLPGFSVKTFSVGKGWATSCELGSRQRFLLVRLLWILVILIQQVVVGMRDALRILQYVCHFLEKDSVLSLNLRVPLCERIRLQG